MELLRRRKFTELFAFEFLKRMKLNKLFADENHPLIRDADSIESIYVGGYVVTWEKWTFQFEVAWNRYHVKAELYKSTELNAEEGYKSFWFRYDTYDEFIAGLSAITVFIDERCWTEYRWCPEEKKTINVTEEKREKRKKMEQQIWERGTRERRERREKRESELSVDNQGNQETP